MIRDAVSHETVVIYQGLHNTARDPHTALAHH
jgi:hypothetical protein